MANRVVIDVEARLIDNVSGGASKVSQGLEKVSKTADKANERITKLNKQNATPKISANDSKFNRALAKAERLVKKFGGTKAEAMLGVMDRASQKIAGVTGKVKTFAGNWMAKLGIDTGDSPRTIDRIKEGVKGLARKSWDIVLKVKDYALSPLRTIKNMLFNIKTLAATIFAGVATKKLVMDPVNTADSIESARIAFETKLGSANKAEDFLQSIYKFDEKSPFDTLQIVGIAQQMMNTGWTADSVLGDLGTIGDWASAMGKGEEGISAVTRALGQMRQKGKLSSEEMLQLTEAGVSAWDYLARSMGKTIPEIREMAEDGEIDVTTAISGIIAGMKEFEGSAAATSDRTVSGIIDQVKSLFNTYIKLPWGEGLAAGFKDGLTQIRDMLDENKDKFKEWGAALKEIGTAISTYIADKVDVALEKLQQITSSDAFKAGSGKEKVKMLWDGLIADPLADWWDGGGRDAMIDKAVDLGMALGEGIVKGLTSFVMNHPIAALLLGGGMALKGYGGGSMVFGAGKLLFGGGLTSMLGGTGTAMVAGTGLMGKLAGLGYGLTGGAAGSTLLGGVAAGAGAGAIAGGVSLGSGLVDLYKGYTNNDTAKKTSGWWKVGGVGTGAAVGAMFGGVPGALIGAGIGGVAGWITGKKQADKYTESIKKNEEAIKAQTEAQIKATQTSLAEHFGDIALSAEEMQEKIQDIIGEKFFKETDAVSKALSTMNESFTVFTDQNANLKKTLWKSSDIQGVKGDAKLTKDEINALKSSIESFGDSAQTYVTDAQYAATESITAIMGNSDKAKKLIESTNDYYGKQSEELSGLSKKLNEELEKALSDNVISIKEKESLDKIRSQMANIIQQIQEDEYEAEMNILKAKYLGDMTPEGFGDLMKGTAEQNKTLAESYWDGFGRASVGKSETEIEEMRKGVLDKLSNLWSSTGDLGINTLRETYKEELGIFNDDVATMLEKNTPEQIMSAVENMDEGTRGAIGKMMEHMQPTTEEVEKLVKSYEDAGLKVPEALTSYLETAEFYEALAKGPEAVEKYFNEKEIDIDPKYRVVDPDLSTITNKTEIDKVFSIEANVETEWTYDEFDDEWISPDGQYSFSTDALVEAGWLYNEFEKEWISPDGKYTFKTNAEVNVDYDNNKFEGTKSQFGVKNSYYMDTVYCKVPVNYQVVRGGTTAAGAIKMDYASKQAQLMGGKFRGGLVEGYSDGGYVHGGGKLIRVAEEGDGEMVIPLSQRRRDRALALWEQTGKLLHADFGGNFARGGLIGEAPTANISREAVQISPAGMGGPQSIKIEVGGVELNVHVEGGQDVVEAIEAQKDELADEIAGIIQRAIEAQYQNMPTKKGA